MNKTKLKISIGIPAYNEQENIGALLNELIKQSEDTFIISEIIVISDQSTDDTDLIVKEFSKTHKIVKLFRNHTRRGQALSQNRIIKKFDNDILVLLNADLLPKKKTFIKELIKPLSNNKAIGIVSAKLIPIPPDTFFERIIYFSVQIKTAIFESYKEGNNLFLCRGGARAFSKSFVKKLIFPKLINEDSYSYLTCIEKGFTFVYGEKAKMYIKLPITMHDHLNQSKRFAMNKEEMSHYFLKTLLDEQYFIPKIIVIKVLLEYLFANPFYYFSYIVVLVLTKIIPLERKLSPTWELSQSSKNLSHE
jgi:glycosyltransferase involved in cell wall biosynthesis